MVLEVVTDGKNDKTEKNDQEYVHNKRKRDGTCILFCVPPSFVLIDNKCIIYLCILLCTIIRSKQPVERKQRRTENETVVFTFSQFFSIFPDYAIKAEIILFSEDQNKKNVQLDWQEIDNVVTGRGW